MRRRVAAASLAAVLVLATSPRAAHAEAPSGAEVEEARKHYARGVALYEQGADAAALAELERAYEVAPNWKVLYELAVVELAVHDFAASLGHFERYVAEGADAVKPGRRKEVLDRIALLRQQVATIDFVVVAGAEVSIDDVRVGTSPFSEPVVVNPGHHRLFASKDGATGEARVVSVAGGDHTLVELALPTPVPAPPPPAQPAITSEAPAPLAASPLASAPPPDAHEAVPPTRRARPPAVWIGWATTGALASGAIATGIAALRANDDLTRAKAGGPTTAATLDALSSRAHAFALACDLMSAGALVSAGVTVYFTLRPPAPTSTSAASVVLRIGPGHASLEGAF